MQLGIPLTQKSDKQEIKSLIEYFFGRKKVGDQFYGLDLLKFVNNHGHHPYIDTVLRYMRELKSAMKINYSTKYKPDSLYRIEAVNVQKT